MKTGLVILAAVLALSSASRPFGRCRPPSGMHPFDVDKFAGDWFVVAGLCEGACRSEQEDARITCLRVTYNATRGAQRTTISSAIHAKRDGPAFQRLGSWLGVPVTPGRHAFVQAVGEDATDLTAKMSVESVVTTDYASTALVHSCHGDVNVTSSNPWNVSVVLLVLSRTPRMDARLQQLVDAINARIAPPGKRFSVVNNASC